MAPCPAAPRRGRRRGQKSGRSQGSEVRKQSRSGFRSLISDFRPLTFLDCMSGLRRESVFPPREGAGGYPRRTTTKHPTSGDRAARPPSCFLGSFSIPSRCAGKNCNGRLEPARLGVTIESWMGRSSPFICPHQLRISIMSEGGFGELVPVGGGDAIPLIAEVMTIGRRKS